MNRLMFYKTSKICGQNFDLLAFHRHLFETCDEFCKFFISKIITQKTENIIPYIHSHNQLWANGVRAPPPEVFRL